MGTLSVSETVSITASSREREIHPDTLSLRLWKSGDVKGYNQLVQRYEKPLFYFICRLLRDMDEAKDLLQEAFIRLHRSQDRLREDKNLKSWLFTIANNLCIDHFRKHKPGRVTSVDYQEPEIQNMADSSHVKKPERPDDVFQEQWVKEKILDAIRTLPEKQQMMMTLRSIKGLSLLEIAERAGCSEKTVGTTLFAARKKLVKLLQPVLQDQIGDLAI